LNSGPLTYRIKFTHDEKNNVFDSYGSILEFFDEKE